MALLQSDGRVPLFFVISSNRARYGIMVSSPSFRLFLQKYRLDLLIDFSDHCYHFSNDFLNNGEMFA